MQHLALPRIEIHLPLFEWANRHRAKPFPTIMCWQIDRHLTVTRLDVRNG